MPRSRSETNKEGLARIQRLCCLGMGSEMLMPDLVREVMALIPSRHGQFCWVGSNAEITNFYGTLPLANYALFIQSFIGRVARLPSSSVSVIESFGRRQRRFFSIGRPYALITGRSYAAISTTLFGDQPILTNLSGWLCERRVRPTGCCLFSGQQVKPHSSQVS